MSILRLPSQLHFRVLCLDAPLLTAHAGVSQRLCVVRTSTIPTTTLRLPQSTVAGAT